MFSRQNLRKFEQNFKFKLELSGKEAILEKVLRQVSGINYFIQRST